MTLETLATPRVLIDRTRLDHNIAAMQARARAAGVQLRPHAKTHKSVAIARRQVAAGAIGICCAKLGEAEVFADAGIENIRLPYPVQPNNSERVLRLLDRLSSLSVIVDDLDVARAWSSAMHRAGRRLEVLVKVDVGFHRCGIDPHAATTVDVIRETAALPGLAFCGLLSHAGQAYAAESALALEAIAREEIRLLTMLKTRLEASGMEVREVSVGSTPTARFIGDQPGATEMRPGNYVFFDRTQVGLGAAAWDTCAMSVLSSVVSRPAPTRLVFDAGSKTLTSDGVRGFTPSSGHGAVFRINAAAPDASIHIERLSEEHAVARVPPDCDLRIGDRVRIVPNHACVVTNLADELVFVRGDEVDDTVRVDARGRNR